MKILAIEDQPVAAMLLMALLRSLDCEANLVADGATALARLAEGEHRVVVSDWRMPGMDGLDLCRAIRARGGEYVYFILISTTKITKESRAAALAAGVDDFLAKPVDADELGMRLHVAQRILGFTKEVQQLSSFLPICGYCKKIRDDKKYWQEIESYFHQHQGTQFSHSICPDCYERTMLPQLRKLNLGGLDPGSPGAAGPTGSAPV